MMTKQSVTSFLTPTFDMIRRKFSAGISYSRYFHKDSLNFYTTPIQNEIYSYFSYKGWWLRPSVGVSYGWGTKTEYEKQEYFIWSRLLQQSRSYYVTVTNRESIRDLALTLSLRKDFDWLDVLGKGDLMGFTPVLLLNCGTQNFGFNTTYSAAQQGTVRVNALPSNSSISETTDFAFQSVSAVLRGTYMKGKFLLQPQVFFDYALWETDQRFNTVYAVMVSMSF
jgi:hypothetical protein